MSAPSVPPVPCTPKTSSESSAVVFARSVTATKHTHPAAAPIAMADNGPTNPDAGVIATNPATAPLAAPSAVGLPLTIQSIITQPIVALAAAVLVAMKALVLSAPAVTALPALKPNQPNQSRPAPSNVKGRL